MAGLAGGFAWLLQLNDGPPKNLRIDQIETDRIEAPLVLAIPYSLGTSFTITAFAAWCTTQPSFGCKKDFSAVNSVEHVRYSQGDTYFYDATTQLLYVRVIQTPQTYVTDNLYSQTPTWHLWNLDDLNVVSWDARQHALDRFTFNGITLPSFAWGPYLEISTDCVEGNNPGHCATVPTYVEPEVCPQGYVQVSYDKCCVAEGSPNCYVATRPPTMTPTPQPTFGQGSNLVLNPGFESGLTDSWYANGGSIQLETTEYHSGAFSVLATGRTATWQGPQQNMMGRLFPNTTYRISCWAKQKTVTSTTQKVKLTLRIEDNAGTRWKGVSANVNSQNWTQIQGNILVDITGTALTNIQLYAEGPDVGVDFWVDDVSAVAV